MSSPAITAAATEAVVTDSVQLYKGQYNLRFADYPAMGKPTASHAAVLLSNYTCAACRSMYPLVEKAVSGDASLPGIVIVPGWRTVEGRAIQEIMLALFHEDAGAWKAVSDKIIVGEIDVTSELVGRAAVTTIGAERLGRSRLKHAALIEKQLITARSLQDSNRAHVPQGTLPQLMAGGRFLVGTAEDEPAVVRFLREKSAPAPVLATSMELNPLTAVKSVIELAPLTSGTGRVLNVAFTNSGPFLVKITWAEMPAGCSIMAMPDKAIAPSATSSAKVRVASPPNGAAFEGLITLHTLAMRPDGKIWVGGKFRNYNNNPSMGVALLDGNGSWDSTTARPDTSDVNWVAASTQGMYLGGRFGKVGGKPCGGLARLKMNGTVDIDFSSGSGANGEVFDGAILPDGSLIVVGSFSNYNGTPSKGVVKLMPNGMVAPAFAVGTGAAGEIYSVKII